ncbi:MAG: nitrate/nitrite transporter NrtS [Methylotenera sp.]
MSIVKNSAKISLVVGTILNLINQGPSLFQGEPISWPHLLLNFLVPYCVASYSAAKHDIQTRSSTPQQ